jgi:chromosome segregation ATPase
MGNEKFVNYYIENLIATMNDCLIRNISLQVNERISKEAIEDQVKAIEDLKDTIGSLQKENQSIQDNKQVSDQEKYQNLENSIKEHLDTIKGLNERIAEADKLKNEYENVKHQVQHVDTFRNELTKTREEFDRSKNEYENKINDLKNNYENTIRDLKNGNENAIRDLKNGHENVIKELTDKIDNLQSTPAKRKKIEDVKKETTDTPASVFDGLELIQKDGGSF